MTEPTESAIGKPTAPPALLHTPAEAAEILHVKESWLRRRAGQRRIPCSRLGKHLRFSDADLRAIVTSAAHPARNTPRRATGYRRHS